MSGSGFVSFAINEWEIERERERELAPPAVPVGPGNVLRVPSNILYSDPQE